MLALTVLLLSIILQKVILLKYIRGMRLFREELLLTITRGIGMVVMLEVVRHIPRLLIMQETLHPPSIHYMLMLQTVLHNLLQQTKLLPNIMMKGGPR